MKKVFVTLFPPARNVHVTKGIGLIPFVMSRKYNYESYIASYGENSDYPSLSDTPGLKHWKIERKEKYSFILRCFWRIIFGKSYRDYINCKNFLKKNSPRIDILQIYHVHDNYVGLYAYLYKYYNPKGILYLKLDCGDNTYNMCMNKYNSPLYKDVKFKLRMHLLKKYSDIVSVESTKFVKGMQEIFGDKMIYLPCGCYEENSNISLGTERQNYFLSVANLGLWKGTDILIEAFAQIADKCDWILLLAGPIIPPLETRLEELFRIYPQVKERVRFLGNIQEKSKLYSIYRETKVFVLPTKGESFGTVFVEAKYNGCYTILTEKVAPKDDLIMHEYEGTVVPVDDVESLAVALLDATKKEIYDEEHYNLLREEYCKRFSYYNTLERLQDRMEALMK